MKATSALWFGCLLLILSCSEKPLPKVIIETELGDMVVELDTINAPVTAGNFLHLVEEGTYKGAMFYRVVRLDNQPNNPVKIEVVQGGLMHDSLLVNYVPIKHETTQETGIKHLKGVISMARYEPGTACTEFFICVGDQPELDFGGKRNPDGQGFAAFGEVIGGYPVVLSIQQQSDHNQYLTPPVRINDIRIVK